MNELPNDLVDQVALLVREKCNVDNGYTYFTHQTIGVHNYKVTFKLLNVDPIKEAKNITISLMRED